jgi:hypothetical protein
MSLSKVCVFVFGAFYQQHVNQKIVVRHVVRPERFGFLLHFTVMQDIQHRKLPGLNPSSDYTLDAAGMDTLRKITNLAFASGKGF